MRIHLFGLFLSISAFMAGCDRKPFVEHKVDLVNKNESCSQVQPSFRMISNFGGERFEFEKCLPADYKESAITTGREGDTVVVQFNAPAGGTSQRYAVTLDIDSYPRYQYITIDQDTYMVVKAQ